MEPITFTYTPIKEDLVVPLRAHWMRRPVFIVQLVVFGPLVVFMLGLSVLGCVLTLAAGARGDEVGSSITSSLFFLFCAAAFAALPAMYLWFIPASGARLFKKDERFRADLTWTLDDNHIRIATQFEDTRLDWSNFQQVREIKDYYLLVARTVKLAIRSLPKRAFASPEQERAFRELVERKLGPIK